MSNRKGHRRPHSFRRMEHFIQHRLRSPGRSDRHSRRLEERSARRSVWELIEQWLDDAVEVIV